VITLMSTTPSPIIIVAVLLTNLPLSLGAAARPQPNDDAFPRLTGSRLKVKDHSARCTYTNGETMTITCPEAPGRKAFTSSFTVKGRPGNLLAGVQFRHPEDQRGFVFDEAPPEATGLDPLRDLDNSTLREAMADLNWVARELKLSAASAEFVTAEQLATMVGGRETLIELKRVCYTVVVGMMKWFGTYRSTCDFYGIVSTIAVNTAINNSSWQLTEEKSIWHIKRGCCVQLDPLREVPIVANAVGDTSSIRRFSPLVVAALNIMWTRKLRL
ncbi:hypothetical protein FOZ62_005220, partial [Perkinsus olseni]